MQAANALLPVDDEEAETSGGVHRMIDPQGVPKYRDSSKRATAL
jgi:hypothetical protein